MSMPAVNEDGPEIGSIGCMSIESVSPTLNIEESNERYHQTFRSSQPAGVEPAVVVALSPNKVRFPGCSLLPYHRRLRRFESSQTG